MTRSSLIVVFAFTSLLIGCSGSKNQEPMDPISTPPAKAEKELVTETVTAETPASKRITLDDKGVGTIKSIAIESTIDKALAEKGAEIFKTNCTACHKEDKRFIGPAISGVTERRSPEWIMNMILNPQLMVKENQLAKDLLVEFNGAAMANQNLTEEQARSIYEYFRTIK